MADVAVLSADAERGLERAEELLDEPQVRSVAVFEPAGVGLDPSRVGVRHVAGDPNLEIAYKERVVVLDFLIRTTYGPPSVDCQRPRKGRKGLRP